MQDNSLVKIFGFLFLIVSIYQLSFTLISSSLENEAEDYANSRISEDIEDFISKEIIRITVPRLNCKYFYLWFTL